jgi:hypothetical protein
MIIDIPSNLKLPPNFLYSKGVSGRFSVEFDSDFDAVIYFAGKSPSPKGKTQKPLMDWLMSLGITFDDIRDHRNKILDVIRQLTDVAMDSNYVTVPPIPQSFTVENEEESESENNENLDALLASIRSKKMSLPVREIWMHFLHLSDLRRHLLQLILLNFSIMMNMTITTKN